ncbi:hypothetical protein ACOZ8I_004279 [Salmonella enterica subsp. enterica]
MQQEENVLGINGVPAGIEFLFIIMFFNGFLVLNFFDTIKDTIIG